MMKFFVKDYLAYTYEPLLTTESIPSSCNQFKHCHLHKCLKRPISYLEVTSSIYASWSAHQEYNLKIITILVYLKSQTLTQICFFFFLLFKGDTKVIIIFGWYGRHRYEEHAVSSKIGSDISCSVRQISSIKF